MTSRRQIIETLRLNAWRQCRNLGIYDVEAVLAVAESGSFRKAGQLLGIGQSAVTRLIQKLEDALGVSVFERSPTGARLTTAGCLPPARVRLPISPWTS